MSAPQDADVNTQAPWVVASMFRRMHRDRPDGGDREAMDPLERGLRLYRTWLRMLLCDVLPPDFHAARFANAWIASYLCSSVPSPVEDRRVRYICARMAAHAWLCAHAPAGSPPDDVERGLCNNLPELSEGEAVLLAWAHARVPGLVSPELTDASFWTIVRSLPRDQCERAARRLFWGPRAYRLGRVEFDRTRPTLWLQYPPPRPGYDLDLQAAVNSAEPSLVVRLARTFMRPEHVHFVSPNTN